MTLRLSRRRTLQLAASTALVPLMGCEPKAAEPSVTSGPSEADKAFTTLSAAWLKDAARASPSFATYLGDHAYDGLLDDVSDSGRRERAEVRKHARDSLAAVDRTQLSRDNQVDAVMLLDTLDRGDFYETKVEDWAWDPLTYSDVAGNSLYMLMARDFAPLNDRLLNAASRMEKMPDLLAQTRASLVPERVPMIHAETYSGQNGGAISIIDDLILSQAGGLSESDKARLAAAAETAKKAINEHQAWIDGTLKPNAKGDYKMAAHYGDILRFAVDDPVAADKLLADARADAEAIREEMYSIARDLSGKTEPNATPEQKRTATMAAFAKAASERPPRDKLMDLARSTLEDATTYTREHDIITLPDAAVKIIVMPKFQQGVAVAYCDSPGPLDNKLETFYAISPIPADWTDKQTTSFLSEYNNHMMYEMAVHEAMPGHYVQIWHSNKHPSVTRAVLGSGSFIEGWACYAEDMMVEQGFGADNPLRRLTNLKMRLRSTTNAILDQGVHIEGWSQQQAMDFMTKEAFQEEREAAGKWTRARVSSGQLASYFFGMKAHHALRKDVQAKEGQAFNLKAYHDRVLSHGSPPPRLVRALMMDEAIG